MISLEDALKLTEREISRLKTLDKRPNYGHVLAYLGYLARYESRQAFKELLDATVERSGKVSREELCRRADCLWQDQHGDEERTAAKLHSQIYRPLTTSS